MKNKLKKIFITGGAGFIGSHVAESFFENFPKCNIIILDKLTYAGNKSFISSITKSKRVKFIKCDIINTNKYSRLLKNCDLAINIAAESNVDKSFIYQYDLSERTQRMFLIFFFIHSNKKA